MISYYVLMLDLPKHTECYLQVNEFFNTVFLCISLYKYVIGRTWVPEIRKPLHFFLGGSQSK